MLTADVPEDNAPGGPIPPAFIIFATFTLASMPSGLCLGSSFSLGPWPELPSLPTNASVEDIVLVVAEMIDTICERRGLRGGGINILGKAKQYLTEEFALYLADPENTVANLFSMMHRLTIGILMYCLCVSMASFMYCGYIGSAKDAVVFSLLLLLIGLLITEYSLLASYLWRMSKMASDIRGECMCDTSEKGKMNGKILDDVLGRLLGKFVQEESDAKVLHRFIRESIGDAQCWTWREHVWLRIDGTGLDWVSELRI